MAQALEQGIAALTSSEEQAVAVSHTKEEFRNERIVKDGENESK